MRLYVVDRLLMAFTLEPKVVVSAQVPRGQRDELEQIARDQDRTISYLVRQAVDRYLHEPAIRTEEA